ncbi:hypothetical protein LEMLEM_LOCUS3738 [Lemmus lemmus]
MLFSTPPGEVNSHIPHLHVASSQSSNANTFWFQLGALDMCYVPLSAYEKSRLWHPFVPIKPVLGMGPSICLETSGNMHKYPLPMSG